MISNRVAAWGYVFAYAGFIFYLSSLSTPLAPLARFAFLRALEKYHTDWLFHIVEYTVLGIFLVRAVSLSMPTRLPVWWIAVAWIAGTLYGYSDEWHQRFVPERQYDLLDWAADIIGVSIGIYYWFVQYRKKVNKVYA